MLEAYQLNKEKPTLDNWKLLSEKAESFKQGIPMDANVKKTCVLHISRFRQPIRSRIFTAVRGMRFELTLYIN